MEFDEASRISKENGSFRDEALIIPEIFRLEKELIRLRDELETLRLANELIGKAGDTDEMVDIKEKILGIEKCLAEHKSELRKLDNGADGIAG